MLTALAFTAIALAQKPTAAKWPNVPGGTVWVARGVPTKATKTATSPTVADGLYVANLKEPHPTDRAAVEFLVKTGGNGPVIKFADKTLAFGEDGHIGVADYPFAASPAKPSEPLDLVFVTRYNDVAVYVNGALFTSVAATSPIKITYLRKDWKTSLLGLATYANPLSPGQIKRNAGVAMQYGNGMISQVPDTGKGLTLDLQLTATTEIPEPTKIKPYRNALLSQDYKVLRVLTGVADNLKTGDTIRIFRYGVLEGQKTALKDLRTGDHVRLKIDLLSAYPRLEKEYQVDDLNTTFAATYVEVPNE